MLLHLIDLLYAENLLKTSGILKLMLLTIKADRSNELDARTSVYLHRVLIEGLHALRYPAKLALEKARTFCWRPETTFATDQRPYVAISRHAIKGTLPMI